MRAVPAAFALLAGLFLTLALAAQHTLPDAPLPATGSAAEPALNDPDQVCAGCHAAIYRSYKQTPMGAGSGAALPALLPGSFTQPSSGVTYRVFARGGRAWMSYSREAAGGRPALAGEQELLYFVGSGTHGRTYLYKVGDSWFELPVNFYGRRGGWGMAPAFEHTPAMPAALPVDANCLHCHASQGHASLEGAPNRFAGRPFDQGGVGCASCHGDAAAHVRSGGVAAILNPARLAPAARDSACMQCHLEGNAVVDRPGRSLAQFVPGAELGEYAVYFVRASQASGGRRASSQYEAMLKSACKRASGDRLTCTSCHDPHAEPKPEERVAFYRARCLSCHTSPTLATAHHPEQPDCAHCHMPSLATTDISHEQTTDHDIERVPARHEGPLPALADDPLVPVGAMAAGDRELGLAYAQLAEKATDPALAERARSLLTRAEAAGANDEQLHVHLGLLDQVRGDTEAAMREYAAALRANPYNASALTNRAVLDATRGDLPEAVRLLDRLVRADPTQSGAALDLAYLECKLGHPAQSRALAESLLRFDPDSAAVRGFLATGALGAKTCPAMEATSAAR